MMTDPIADFLSRVRNGLMARHKTVTAPHSKMKARIAQILKDEGYIADFSIEKNENQGVLHLTLRYDDENRPLIEGIERISKPGLRIYKSVDDLPKVRGGLGMAVISTSKGIMTDQQARRDRIGGEILCQVW
jgi:small subunit ribosomal protein S8